MYDDNFADDFTKSSINDKKHLEEERIESENTLGSRHIGAENLIKNECVGSENLINFTLNESINILENTVCDSEKLLNSFKEECQSISHPISVEIENLRKCKKYGNKFKISCRKRSK